MSSQDLPAVVLQRIPEVRRAAASGNAAELEELKRWGFATIEAAYDPHPIFRPHHTVLRELARAEWRRTLHDLDRQLRQVMAQQQAAGAAYTGQRQLDEARYEDAESRRQRSALFDAELRVREHRATRGFETDEQIRLAEALARINGPAQREAAPPDPLQISDRVNAEIGRIHADPTLSYEQKHSMIDTLQKTSQRAWDQHYGRGK